MVQIANYEISATLFSSASTRVFRGKNKRTGQLVILRTSGDGGMSPSQRARLSFSFDVLSKFNHPNIVKVLDWVDDAQYPCIVMEDSGSVDLRRYTEQFEDRQFPVQLFLDIAIQLASALDEIHHAQVIHKDLHPGNIVINPETGRVQVIDFGMASLLTREQPLIAAPEKLEGILSYLSPEQTGRMNRALDYRSDFYTLGVTFYQLLTGSLPFTADDALGMVYAHLAVQQESAAHKRPGIPAVIASIIDKMMMKNAEERYQSAFGLKRDLIKCRDELKKNGTITSFSLASEDISGRFCIPQKLYGRESEVSALMACFEKASQGFPSLLTISGYSGIGKSALVHEIHKPIAASDGVFVSGKFDQFQQNTPYSAIKVALSGWLKQELRLPEDKLRATKQAIFDSLGVNLSVLLEFMPEFEMLTGPQPEPMELGLQETYDRFILVIQSFIKAITMRRPLVLFIDDLQWADRGTLNLLPEIMGEPGSRLLILAAYRNNEVSEGHPAQSMFKKVAKSQVLFQHIELSPLSLREITSLLVDTLYRSESDVRELSELIINKTGGNPFFTTEFLKTLYRKELLTFDIESHYWTWNSSAIKEESITDNVVELMLDRMAELPGETQQLLQKAACVGTRFDLETLATVSDLEIAQAARTLWPALKEGLLVQEGGDWFLGLVEGVPPTIDEFRQCDSQEFIEEDSAPSQGSIDSAAENFIPQCKFLHDRMLQAAYESLDSTKRVETHLDIGWRLYRSIAPERRRDWVFELLEQLNHGVELISDSEERERLITLNVIAAEKSKAASVWVAADRYAQTALELIGENGWEQQYNRWLLLSEIAAESAYFSGQVDVSDKRYLELIDRAIDPLDKADLLTQRLVQAIGRSDYYASLDYGRKALALLGVDIPEEQNALLAVISEDQARLELALEKCPVSNFDQLPECTDRAHQLSTYLLVNFGLAGLLSQDPLLVVAGVQKALLIVTEHGRTETTLVLLTSWGLLQVKRDNYKEAYEAGAKAKALLEKSDNCRETASAWNGIAVALAHLKGPLMDSYEAYQKGFEVGLQTGELARAGVCLAAKSTIKGVAGYPVQDALNDLLESKQFIEQKSLKVPFIPVFENLWRSFLDCKYLLGEERFDPGVLKALMGSTFKSALLHSRFEYQFWAEADVSTLLAFLFPAAECYELFKFHFMTVDLYTLCNLAVSRAIREGYFENKDEEKSKWLVTCSHLKSILLKRAALYPPNCGHKADLVEAEELALSKAPFEEVARRYQKAIDGAEQYSFAQYAGLANECFARYLSDSGFESLSEVPLIKAHAWYKRWGNRVKLKQFEARNHLTVAEAKGVYPQSAHLDEERVSQPDSESPVSSSSHSQSSGSGLNLDFQSIVKSMQAISSELDLQNLIKNMLNVILENAGAQIAVLVIDSPRGPEVEAQVNLSTGQAKYLKHTPLENAKSIPHEMINVTLRIGDTICLDHACIEGDFVDDHYISESRAKSVLCMPISYRNTSIGALYLENTLSTGAFTAQRLSVIRVLLAQAAISLENARLFNEVTGLNAGLEDKVAQRTQDLDLANEELAVANKELESFSYSVSHDLKSPLRMIKGFSDILLEDYGNQLDTEAQRLLGKVVAGAKSMEDLINGLLDLSRMQRKEVQRENLNLSQIANDVVADLRDADPTRVVHVDVQRDITVDGDARMMHSVIENLLNNAWKYSSKTEEARISFSELVSIDRKGRKLRVFKISDNGAGFDMAHADKLFSTFQRLHNKKDFEGTGVGLSTVKRIIEKHGGEIWAEAQVNKGASFYFTIPDV